MGSGGRNKSNSHRLARIGEKKIFHETDLHHFWKVGNKHYSHQDVRIGVKKIFHELDVHHVYKVGIKRFWAQEAEMSLTAIRKLQSARRKFFMKPTYITSRK